VIDYISVLSHIQSFGWSTAYFSYNTYSLNPLQQDC